MEVSISIRGTKAEIEQFLDIKIKGNKVLPKTEKAVSRKVGIDVTIQSMSCTTGCIKESTLYNMVFSGEFHKKV
jgi:hypothetical protein